MVDGRAVYDFGARSSGEAHGVVLTKPHVVRLILELAGYVPERDLARLRLLEPSCGHGAFLVQAVERLLASAAQHGRALGVRELGRAITAFDVDANHVSLARQAVVATLLAHGVDRAVANKLASKWIRVADFLLTPLPAAFDCIVGNPPYVRVEQIAAALQAEYRSRFASIFDRADLYVAFIERGSSLLSARGVLSFICADRWLLNKYGAPLRALLTEHFRVLCYIDLHRASPFESEVIAYPAIFAITRGHTDKVVVAKLDNAGEQECAELAQRLRQDAEPAADSSSGALAVYDAWFSGDEPWVISSPEQLRALRDLEARFSPIEHTAKVGIGVATGKDELYVVDQTLDIERDRLLPLVMREDLASGRVHNASRYVINTFARDGALIELAQFPKLRAYFARHAAQIKRRHVAKKNPRAWFRTIDRVYPELARAPKLLIPDIAGANEVVFESGQYHPHHNLYFVTSSVWDLEVLGGLLSSRVALFFVWSYAVKMRGRYLRFQAQYLRRIRLPDPNSLDAKLERAIKAAFQRRDFTRLDALALQAYGLPALPAFDFVDTRR
ncbi:MAG TPA: Eco57I restriction-modification methylase domain-containing protein [Polyangiales bacterium]|nr:Eco57I restriction-modification methylase domain-containing protein [Polyangiales bacterium]